MSQQSSTATASGPALRVSELVVRYPRADRSAVDGLSLTAEPGQVTALLGPNGAGKTSTVETCVGLRKATSGEVEVLGRSGAALDTPEHRALVGVMLQDGGLPTGAKPLALLRHLASMHRDPLDVTALAERLGIPSFAGTGIRRLSGGQKQRVALAAALVGRPRLVFLDEPTAGLDPQTTLVVHDLVRELVDDGVAVVLTTHDMADAEDLADHVVIVDAGRVVAAGSPGELTRRGRPTIRIVLDRPLPTGDLVLPPEASLEDLGDGEYHVTGDVGPYALLAVAQWLADAAVTPVQLAERERTLEDVFLDITGRELR